MTDSASPSTIISDAELASATRLLAPLRQTLREVIFGQDELIDLVLTGILSRGHILLEGLPGLGKTELVKGLSAAMALQTRRVQFTPDLLPGDITGNPILQENNGRREFVFQPGPIFSHILLADEINRASPKTQAALLEAMQEHQVSVLGQVHPLPQPFFVLATQNPIDLEGTYPLPEAQLDRFLFKLNVQPPGVETLERIIQGRQIGESPEVAKVMDAETLQTLLGLVRRVFLPEVIARYIARIVHATQPGQTGEPRVADLSSQLRFGASPRAALALAASVRARALLMGRHHASYEDVQALAAPVLRHRIQLDYQARLGGVTADSFIADLLKRLPAQDKAIAPTLAAASQA